MDEVATLDIEAIRHWTRRQKWGEHDEGGLDGYCVILALCDEVDRLRGQCRSGEADRG